jgi:hypothetical protein
MSVMQEKLAEQARRGGNGKTPGGWRGFVDIYLTDVDKARVKEMSTEALDVCGYIGDLVNDGLKLTLSADPENSSFVAAVTGKVEGDPNHGLTMNGRGGSLERAICAVWYKHVEVAQRGVWGNVSRGYDPDDVS